MADYNYDDIEDFMLDAESGEVVNQLLSKAGQAYANVQMLNTEVTDLQNQIDNLILDTGDSPNEVIQARSSSSGINYDTLKERLDAEYEKSELTNERVDDLNERLGIKKTSFIVGTSQHSSRIDMIPWSGKAGDKFHVVVAASPALSPQRNGGIYTYYNDTGSEYGSILIDGAGKDITLTGNCDSFGVWVPALTEDTLITVTIESYESIDNKINKFETSLIKANDEITKINDSLLGKNQADDIYWSDDIFKTVHINNGGYIDSSDGISIVSSSEYGYTDYIPIDDAMLIKLLFDVVSDVPGHRMYVYASDKTYLAKSEVFYPTTSTPFIFTGYANSKFLRFSVKLSDIDKYGLLFSNRGVYSSDNIKDTNRSISNVSKMLETGKLYSANIINWDGMLTGTFINSSGTVTYFKEAIETGYIDVDGYEKISIKLNPNVSRGRALKFYDSNDSIVLYQALSSSAEVAVPTGAVKIRLTIFSMTNDGYSDIPYIKIYGVYGSQGSIVSSPYNGKKISILGDSISTFANWIYPSTNRNYYTGSNAGVSSVTDTWWYKLIDALGATLEKNNSYSGSPVTTCRSGETNPPETGIDRCENLGSPDVIIVRMGTNDFYYGAALGNYDGTSAIPTGETTFSEAFAKMLAMIMEKYKTAEIWVCTMTQFERLGPVGYPEKNSHGETIAEWNERIREIAKALGAKILDNAMCGMTYFNLGIYTDDQPYETTGNGLHPNADGHSLIANDCIRTMDASTRTRY